MSTKFKVGDRVVTTCECPVCEPIRGHVGFVESIQFEGWLFLRFQADAGSCTRSFSVDLVEHAPEAAGEPEEAELVTWVNSRGFIVHGSPDIADTTDGYARRESMFLLNGEWSGWHAPGEPDLDRRDEGEAVLWVAGVRR